MATIVLSSTSANNAIAYYNGRIYTVNKSHPWAEAFIVSPGGVFEAVGTNQEILSAASERNLVRYDLRQRFIMPGIHDAHTHLFAASMQKLNEAGMGQDATERSLSTKLRDAHCACAYSNVVGDWVIGSFYDTRQFPDGRADRKYLDEMYPDQPVMIRDISIHNILLNTAALKKCGIDPDNEPDPEHGYYVRRPDGSLTGELVEQATLQAYKMVPIPPLAYVKEALRYGIEMCHRFGVTSCQEASANTTYLHAMKELENENSLNLDLYTHIVCLPEIGPPYESRDGLWALLDVADAFRSKHLHPKYAKFFLDGAPIPPNSTQCDLTTDGVPDESRINISFEDFYSALRKFDARGFTCKVHAAGQGSVRRALDAFEKLRREHPDGPRHEVAHCNEIHSDDIRRFRELRITAEMSPAIFHLNMTPKERFRWPFNQVLADGGHVTIGSDWILTPNPSLFDALASIVDTLEYAPGGERRLNGLESNKKQIGGEIICEMITLSGAKAVGAEYTSGSIEVGKRANFIAVDRDLSQGEFSGAKVLKTWFEGRMVYNGSPDGERSLC